MGLKVGVTREDRFVEHKTGHFHPEHPRRIQELYRMLDRDFSGGVMEFQPQPAALEDVERVHTPAHVRRILKTAELPMTNLAPDTPVSTMTYMAAWLAAGACIQGVDLLLEKHCQAFFVLIRPPGHHALPDRSGGFCVFNNIAVAAEYARVRHNARRILVVDWDVHHGNGISDIFYENDRIYYFSTHDRMLYPHSGAMQETGDGPGRGYTMNIELSRDFTDQDMVYLYSRTMVPVIRGFAPELIMVAAGFDAHCDDPVGRCLFSENIYARLTRLILDAADTACGKIPLLFALEGGYEPPALVRCVGSVLSELTADTDQSPQIPDSASPEALDLVGRILEIHQPFGVMA
ncbi:MAG: histone deacetylase [Desulfosalsimonas sp.]|uniref:histone deacetylase family protein n=1 Tax=Desulfosalsimonas sp. TaxID=3073848 RepID=UPI003970593E